MCKPAITEFCKSFSVSLAKQRKTFKNFLFAIIGVATRNSNWPLVISTKEKLKNILNYEAYGVIIRSRQKQNAEEELASLYHLNKIPKAGLTAMKVAVDGVVGYKPRVSMEVSRDPVKIEKETVHFMQALLNGRQNQDLEYIIKKQNCIDKSIAKIHPS